MNINKCRTCKHYDSFFMACSLYTEDVYLGEGDIDVYPVGVQNITKSECEYEVKDKRGE